MKTSRLEAFSDGVIAILITIMVLELEAPHGRDLAALRPLLPVLASYALSFILLGIYWNNHHHMLHAAERTDGKVLWANLHLLFWLSLMPFTTAWMGSTGAAPLPVAVYGVVLVLSAVAYTVLQATLIAVPGQHSQLAKAVGGDVKGKLSMLAYAIAIPLAFVERWISIALYVAVALAWLVPDRRIESRVSPRDAVK
jgi:TMEM175 potassium channel family protein